jgi:hypothetical protein
VCANASGSQWPLYISPVYHSAILRSAHTVYLCVWCGSENKQRLFPYTTLTDRSINQSIQLPHPTYTTYTYTAELQLSCNFQHTKSHNIGPDKQSLCSHDANCATGQDGWCYNCAVWVQKTGLQTVSLAGVTCVLGSAYGGLCCVGKCVRCVVCVGECVRYA